MHNKSSEVSIKTRSTPASLPFRGLVTKPTTVKWSIDAKGNVIGDCDASIYGEMLFIFITEKAAQKF